MSNSQNAISEQSKQQLKAQLTDKQRAFLEEYLYNGFNGVQAALATYATQDYGTAQSMATENLSKPVISEIIRRRLEEKALAANEVLARLAAIARGDIGDFLEVDDNGVIKISLDRARKLGLTHLIKKVRSKQIPEKDANTGDILYTHEIQLELYSSHDALRDIARTLGLFKDNIHANIEGQVGVLKIAKDLDEESWANSVAKYRTELESKIKIHE